MKPGTLLAGLLCMAMMPAAARAAELADIILVNGKIVTVDDQFRIAQAVAVE